jgi:hypothetical protein
MIEQLIIGSVFLLALVYLGNMVRKQFRLKDTGSCAKGCGCASSELAGSPKKDARMNRQPHS